MLTLTKEQELVVHHQSGHARVLAVAGSGKTSTMVFRIRHLIEERGINPKGIRALMFNRLASDQFRAKILEIGIRQERSPHVSTFHSFAYQFVQQAITDGLIPGYEFWTGDEEERVRVLVHRTMLKLVKHGQIPEGSVEVDDALDAIGLWKGALIPPERAGHRFNEHIPLVYAAFEAERMRSLALTFDDFVPEVVKLLLENERQRARWSGQLSHLIVDEYQDVNLGQQTLIELLAGEHAEVMVVGDDDQTIYEWRGARPDYIIRDFQASFTNMPHSIYKLTHSFRFGPVISQCAHNVISRNSNRQEKRLLAYDVAKQSHVVVLEEHSEQKTDVNKELAEEIVSLVTKQGVLPNEIWVLGRMFAQLSALEARLLAYRVPYRVLGGKPFFERREIQTLLSYLELAIVFHDQLTSKSVGQLLAVANTPNRKLSKKKLQQACYAAKSAGMTPAEMLRRLIDDPQTPLYKSQLDTVEDLYGVFQKAHELASANKNAGEMLEGLLSGINYEQHFTDYYGAGEDSFERMQSVTFFVIYAKAVKLNALDFIAFTKKLDSTRGAPEDEQITLTTVYRTKGLEFDYVIIPSCIEGFMPCLYGDEMPVFDKEGVSREPEPSLAIENERRLFYVAITRARKASYIGTSSQPQAGRISTNARVTPSRFLEEIMLAETEGAMAPLAHVAEMTFEDQTLWFKHIREIAGRKHIIGNLLHALYQVDAAAIAERVSRITATVPESPFQYKYAYIDSLRIRRIQSRPDEAQKRLSSPWQDLL